MKVCQMFQLVSWCIQEFFNQIFVCRLQKRSIFYLKMGRKAKKKLSKNDQNIMTSVLKSVKNRPGDLLEALWRRLGCPRGPRLNFGSEQLVRWTPPGLPDGVHFSICFQCNTHLIFVRCVDAFLSDLASILEANMHPKWSQGKTCVFDFKRLV